MICLELVTANTPWYKMQVLQFCTVLEKYTRKHIADKSVLSKNYRKLGYYST